MGIEGYARWLYEQYPDCFTVSSLSLSLSLPLSLSPSLPFTHCVRAGGTAE